MPVALVNITLVAIIVIAVEDFQKNALDNCCLHGQAILASQSTLGMTIQSLDEFAPERALRISAKSARGIAAGRIKTCK